MTRSPADIGAAAEREVAIALGRAGHVVYVPFLAAHARVDLVADVDGRLLRVQVKAARVVGDALSYRVCSNTKNSPLAYVGEVDAFGVRCAALASSYLVPIDHVATRTCNLRLAPARNNQAKGVRWAADYEIRPLRPG